MKKAKNHPEGVSGEALAAYQQQCESIGRDWAQLRNLLDAYRQPDVDKEKLEWELISLKSRLSCDYPILTQWRKGGFGLSAGINKMLSGATNLASMADSGANPDSRVNQTWREVQTSLQKVMGAIRGAQDQLAKGKEARLPDELLIHNTERPFPIKKILKGTGIAVGVILLIGVFYVMRNFLGFWAPGAGDGLIVDASMSDEDKIQSVLFVMNDAFAKDSVDLFMTTIAKDFKDDEGNNRTKLRVGLQAYHQKGLFKEVTLDWSRMEFLEKDGFIYVRPIYVHAEGDKLTIHLGFKPYDGKLLIATASAT